MQIVEIKSKLKLVSGLHIGAGNDSMKIGGIDSPVLKREILCDDEGVVGFGANNRVVEPYIAGSSLKGKVRSLLEHHFGLIDLNGNVVTSKLKKVMGDKTKEIDLIVKLFGEAGDVKDDTENLKVTRAIFRDCFITQEVRKAKLQNKIELFESKSENVIDRLKGTTKNGGLRQIERVNSAIEFDFEISIRIFDGDDQELLEDTIKLGLKLLERDALGGSGSRGYGKVKFTDIAEKIDELREKVNK